MDKKMPPSAGCVVVSHDGLWLMSDACTVFAFLFLPTTGWSSLLFPLSLVSPCRLDRARR